MKTIIASRGEEILVDDEDFEMVSQYRWHVGKRKDAGYAVCDLKLQNGRSVTYSMHRMILGLPYGDPRRGDHRNPNKKLDNRRYNLRICTHAQNCMNRRKKSGSSNPFKGVKSTRSGRWEARICVEKKYRHLGTFDTAEEAHAEYRKAALQMHGEFANFGD